MKKGLCLFALFVWFIGIVASIGYALYYKEGAVIIAGLIIAAAFGIPSVKNLWKKFNE